MVFLFFYAASPLFHRAGFIKEVDFVKTVADGLSPTDVEI